MATSGSKSVTVTSYDTLKFSWSQSSQSISANSTTVSWKLQLIAGSSGRISSSASKDWSVTVNGSKYSGTNTIGIANNATKTLASGVTTIGHAADGTKTFSYSFAQEFGITFSGSSIGTISGSGSGTLNTIPRATSPSLSSTSVYMGSAVTISTPRASSSFTHDLAYSFAGAAYVSITTGVGTSYSWTVPDLASKIPNASSGTVTVRCITKNGSTTVGTKTVTMTAKVPTSVVPTISSVAVSEATSGLAAQFGAYIQGKSKLAVTVTAAGAKGSTIKSYKTTLGGSTWTARTFTTGTLPAGSVSLVTTVTDSRGRTAKKTTKVTVLAYTKPAIQELAAYRYDAAGNPDQDGEYIAVRYKYTAPTLNGGNTVAMRVQYKLTTATAWEDLLTGTALSADTTATPASPTFSADYSYDVRLTVTDYFGAAVTTSTQLPTAAVVFDIGADGLSMAVGKTAELTKTFELAWELKTAHGEIPKDAVAIPGSADLDDYTAPGYYVFSSASSATIANLPIGGSGSGCVEVKREGEGTQVRQIVTRCSVAKREVWERLYYSNTWQAWLPVYKGGTGSGRVLWSGGKYMTAEHIETLAEPVSAQPSGIVLVFSEYVDGEAKNQSFHRFFVDKTSVALESGVGCVFQMSTSNLAYFATKYLYISDTRITGHANNNTTGTGACGITYTNNRFVLRYVIGV